MGLFRDAVTEGLGGCHAFSESALIASSNCRDASKAEEDAAYTSAHVSVVVREPRHTREDANELQASKRKQRLAFHHLQHEEVPGP